MIGLALSGGGSRAIAFHLGCLRALGDLGVLDQIAVISTISGGSVIGAYYAYSPGKSFVEFDEDIRSLLRTGLHGAMARQILRPINVMRSVGLLCSRKKWAAWKGFRGRHSSLAHRNRTDLFHDVLRKRLFPDVQMSSQRRNDMDVVIGACELRTGSAFRFGNRCAGGWRYGELVDWDVDVSLAVAASAAYPIFLPSLDRTWKYRKNGFESEHRVLLTDGGVYDNLGVSVLEPGRSSDFTIHRFDCDYVIACSAGHGQESGTLLPTGLFARVNKSFDVIHRRVQDSTMTRLHHLNEARLIKGFALPYLGQQDHRLPIRPADLVPRATAVGYPTNFAPMQDNWIDTLSKRGEQLTRLLVSHYLPEVCR